MSPLRSHSQFEHAPSQPEVIFCLYLFVFFLFFFLFCFQGVLESTDEKKRAVAPMYIVSINEKRTRLCAVGV